MKIELYIAGLRADLNDDSFVLMNYTHDDLTNPTILKNSFSQQIELPGTEANNRIFGAIFRFDRRTVSGGGGGLNFDAAKKTPFKLLNGYSCMESGYLKLDGIKRIGDKVSYRVSLFGGLGSFFYNLSYDIDGNKRNLASLSFSGLTDFDASQIESPFVINRAKVAELWEDMDLNILSFAPCYNGLPSDFDASKCVAGPFLTTDGGFQIGWPLFLFYRRSVTDNNVTYSPYDKRWAIFSFGKDLTEWQMSDVRSYLQRPVIRLKAIIDAICLAVNNGGYAVTLDSTFFNESNPYYYKTWLTLPLLTEIVSDEPIRSGSTITKDMLLGSTASPADYLISMCKMFGLSVLVDNAAMTVEILTRDSLFDKANILDIDNRVDYDQAIDINPYPFNAKWYAMRNDMQGAYADRYKITKGKTFGEQRINTGYDFDVAEKNLLEGIVYRGAVDVLESDAMLSYIDYHDGNGCIMPPAIIEGGDYSLYEDGGDSYEVDITRPGAATLTPINATYPYYDIFAKPQFHDADNKAIDGSNVLLFFRGREDVSANKALHLSDDPTTLLDALNDGKPCWFMPFILDGSNIGNEYCDIITSMPSFGRYIYDGNTITHSLDFGNPAELAIPGKTIEAGAPLYPRYWQSYIGDRFDSDSKVVTCYADLRGLPKGNDLLRRIVYFGGALWSVNRIINQALSHESLTQIELIRIQNKNNYI